MDVHAAALCAAQTTGLGVAQLEVGAGLGRGHDATAEVVDDAGGLLDQAGVGGRHALAQIEVVFQADADAIRLGIEPIPASERKRTGSVLKEGWHFIPPFVVLIYTLFSLNWTPELSALAAAGTTLVLSWFFFFL